MPISNERIVWIDCEMTGLDTINDALIEVAALVTDSELNILGDGVDVVIKPDDAALAQMNDFVRDMHTRSGLLAELPHGKTMAEAQAIVLDYIKKWVPDPKKAPLGGNSVGTDRVFLVRDMPELVEHLHYRVIDVSTIKELSRRWYARAYFQSPAKLGGHRALGDIQDSIDELRYYREAVFVPAPGAGQCHGPADRQEGHGHGGRTGAGRGVLRDTGAVAPGDFAAHVRIVICATFCGKFWRKPGKWQKQPRRAGKLFVVAFSASRFAGGHGGAHGGRSSVGRAPGCGPGGRGFNPRRSPS